MALTLKKVLPNVGSRVQVTGIYVIDIRDGEHAELHPAYQIQKALMINEQGLLT